MSRTNLNEFFSDPANMVNWIPRIRKVIICNDGFNVSVQASRGHYCSPRENVGPWVSVEIGYPSAPPPAEMMKYAENSATPMDSVYGWVPIEMVEAMIDSHGGMV
jgi:hypothetical protein